MRRRILSAVGWLTGWLVNPAVAWGLMTGTGATVWAALVGLPAVVVALIALAAVTLSVVLVHYGLALRDRRRAASAEARGWEERRQGLDDAQLFVAVEAEIALAREEALEIAKLLRKEWPYITVDGALVQTALPSWRAKTTDFIGAVLGAAQRAAFKASETGSDVLERLESEGRFLESLATTISADSIRTDEAGFLAARRERREHDAASFLDYNHYRAPGAPPLAGHPDQRDASETRFEQWLGDRLRAADEIERERRVGHDRDSYYLDAMQKWDIENMEQLEPLRPDLFWSYRENAKTGEKEPGPRVTTENGRRVVAPGEWERYYGERIAWLRRTLQGFREDSAAA